jgi:hypothetical protein
MPVNPGFQPVEMLHLVVAELVYFDIFGDGGPRLFISLIDNNLKNSILATKGVCPVCGTKIFRIGKS